MTLGERGEWAHGGVRYPLTEDMSNSLLRDADPALSMALDYFCASLDIHIGARLRVQALREGIKINAAVATRLAIEPTPAVLADNFQFPLFTLYRTTVSTQEHTVYWNKDVGEWAFAYVLPVMTPRQIANVSPILRSVERCLAHAIRQGREPTYRNNEHIWTTAGLQSIKMRDVRYEPYVTLDQQNGTVRAITGTMEVVERDMEVPGAFPPFAGTNLAIDMDEVPEVTTVATYSAPTLSSITPNVVSKSGGTPLVLTGTGFRAPLRLALGRKIVDVVVLSETSATAVSPEHEAYPTFMADAVLLGPTNVRLPAGLTFTTP